MILQVHFEKHACNFSSLYGLNAGYIKYGCLLYLIIAEEYCLMSLNITIFFYYCGGKNLKRINLKLLGQYETGQQVVPKKVL